MVHGGSNPPAYTLKKLNPRRQKALSNAAFAAKFPRRSKKTRRKARHARVCANEALWLDAMGIQLEPDQKPCGRK